MKILFALILLILTNIAFGQDLDKDFHFKKSLKQNGLQYQFTVLDEDKRGVWHYDKSKFYFWYKAQKVLSTQGGASGQLLNGSFEVFHENKQLAQKGKFCKGLKDGKWTYWRNDGTLIVIENWNKGKLTKTKENFNENGESRELTKYSWFTSTRENSDSVVITKNNGKIKTICIKDENGNLIEKQSFKNGELKDVKQYSEERKDDSDKRKEDSTIEKESFFKRIFKKKEKDQDKTKKEPKADKTTKEKKEKKKSPPKDSKTQ